jgi:hypothetical protein
MEHHEIAGQSAQGSPDDGSGQEKPLLSLRATVIISISVTTGLLAGRAAGIGAGCATGMAVADTLNRIIGKNR